MSLRKRVVLGIAGASTLLIFAAFLLLAKPAQTRPPPWTVPVPNGYDTFVRASAGLRDLPYDPTRRNYRGYVSSNTEAFRLFKRGLSEQTRMPLLYPQRGQMSSLGVAVGMEGKAAEDRSDWNSAASIYLDLIQYGQAREHGSLIDLELGLTSEKWGVSGLSNVINKLPLVEQTACRRRARELNESRISFEEVLECDDFTSRKLAENLFQYLWYKHLPSSRKTRAEIRAWYDRTKSALGNIAEPGGGRGGETRRQ